MVAEAIAPSAALARPSVTSAAPSGPLVVLGAGYAGLTIAREVSRRARRTLPVVLIDRNPSHVLRTQLYEVGKLASDSGKLERWALPLARLLERTSVEVRQATVESIDLTARTVTTNLGAQPFGSLAICLGSVAAYYGVPGAEAHTHQVYRLSKAREFARALALVMEKSADLPGEARPRVVVVGGGSTGVELAAEIATTDWSQVVGREARHPDVVLVTGALPLLAGFPPEVVAHARDLLRRAGVAVIHGVNVSQVEDRRVHLADGTVFACDLAVWCAGLQPPPSVANLPVPHGRAGRVVVEPTLEVPGHPGIFAVGDVAEVTDPETKEVVPSTAQAALAEARFAAANVVARSRGEPLHSFRYREQGVVVALGVGRAAGRVRHLTLWGSPASLLKRIVQTEYSRSAQRGESSRLI